MKPAKLDTDYRTLVRTGYDQIAPAFNQARASESPDELRPLLDLLPVGSTVLDLGCGSGVPIARALARDHNVIGLDISAGQLSLAVEQVPGGQFIQGDLTRCHFRAGAFAAVVSFYAIFHTPLSEHPPLIRKISDWLTPGGYFLATLSPQHQEGYTEEFFGTEMFWSNLGLEEYIAIIEDSGIDVLQRGTVGHGYSDEGAKPEAHPLVLAKKVR
jgi:SAM-dependent methyltransferase